MVSYGKTMGNTRDEKKKGKQKQKQKTSRYIKLRRALSGHNVRIMACLVIHRLSLFKDLEPLEKRKQWVPLSKNPTKFHQESN